jgi:osmoprotectant transport system substrate-binding protein
MLSVGKLSIQNAHQLANAPQQIEVTTVSTFTGEDNGRGRRRSRRLGAGLALVLAVSVGLAACGSDDDGDGGGSADTPNLGSLTVADAGFTESQVLAEIYGLLLEDAGYTVERISVQSTEIAQSSLESGDVDAMPQYVATYAELLNVAKNGVDAEPVASGDLEASVAALRELTEPLGLTALDPAEAVDQNAFAVSESFAAEFDLETLSDLGASGTPVRLAAGPECSTRPFCQPGLEETYGINVTEIVETGVSTAQTKAALRDGDAELGLVLTTDAVLDGLVVLEDDKKLQNADNLVPIVNTESLTPEITEALNGLAPVLTTEDLAELNRKVDADREKPLDVAREYLEGAGLLTA